MSFVSIEDIEAEALKLSPKERARLAGRLLESLEDLSGEESEPRPLHLDPWLHRRHRSQP